MDLILYIITMPCGFISTSKSLKLQISTHVHPTVLRKLLRKQLGSISTSTQSQQCMATRHAWTQHCHIRQFTSGNEVHNNFHVVIQLLLQHFDRGITRIGQLLGHRQGNIYRRTGFNCENLIIANCEFFQSSQTFDSQTYSINSPPLRAICADTIIKFTMYLKIDKCNN